MLGETETLVMKLLIALKVGQQGSIKQNEHSFELFSIYVFIYQVFHV